MRKPCRLIVVSGAALVLGAQVAIAQMEPSPPAPDLYGAGPMRGRLADRALRDFDLDRNGKIAKAEMGTAISARFSQMGGAKGMSVAAFVNAHEQMLQTYSREQFKRLDWNGDRVLSLDEFRVPFRTLFVTMDREATGVLPCQSNGGARGIRGHTGAASRSKADSPQDLRGRRSGGRIAPICQEADFNKDGKLTRAEFDRFVTDEFARASKGGKGLLPDGFYGLERASFEAMEARRFKRLDKNKDGKLSESEFAAPGQKLFARLDKNRDGVLTREELSKPGHVRHPAKGTALR